MNNSIISKQDVQLTTLSVQIKALTLNDKRLTQIVFKQLPVLSPFVVTSKDVQLLPGIERIGYVRYSFDVYKTGQHILFIYDKTLYRWFVGKQIQVDDYGNKRKYTSDTGEPDLYIYRDVYTEVDDNSYHGISREDVNHSLNRKRQDTKRVMNELHADLEQLFIAV